MEIKKIRQIYSSVQIVPFINKLAACWQRQNNLLSNPIILPAPGWLMIPAHHDPEESKENWLSLFPKISSALCFLFFFSPCLIAILVMWRIHQDAETQSMECIWMIQARNPKAFPSTTLPKPFGPGCHPHWALPSTLLRRNAHRILFFGHSYCGWSR